MGRFLTVLGPGMAAVFGVLIMYSTFQPELLKERARREEEAGISFTARHVSPAEHAEHVKEAEDASRDTVISRAMASDFREAGVELRKEGGFAWAIRKQLFGSGKGDDGKTKEGEEAAELGKK